MLNIAEQYTKPIMSFSWFEYYVTVYCNEDKELYYIATIDGEEMGLSQRDDAVVHKLIIEKIKERSAP